VPEIELLQIFQGIATMVASEPIVAIARVVLIALGIMFVYLGANGTLEPLIMLPMGVGMASVNAGVLYLSATTTGTLFIDPTVSDPAQLLEVLQINFLQPIYTFTFSNGLIAVLIFMGIGVLSDIGYMLISPFRCMTIAIFAELGTLLTFPIAVAMGLPYNEAAAIAMAHPRWGERPLLVIVRRDDAEITADDIQTFLADKVAKWWLPDDITFVDELPHTATGKISKLTLRQQFADYNLPTAEA